MTASMPLIESLRSQETGTSTVTRPLALARSQFKNGEDPSLMLTLAEINLNEFLLRNGGFNTIQTGSVVRDYLKAAADCKQFQRIMDYASKWPEAKVTERLQVISRYLLREGEAEAVKVISIGTIGIIKDDPNRFLTRSWLHMLKIQAEVALGEDPNESVVAILDSLPSFDNPQRAKMLIELGKVDMARRLDPKAYFAEARVLITSLPEDANYTKDHNDSPNSWIKACYYDDLAIAQIEAGLFEDARETLQCLKEIKQNGTEKDFDWWGHVTHIENKLCAGQLPAAS